MFVYLLNVMHILQLDFTVSIVEMQSSCDSHIPQFTQCPARSWCTGRMINKCALFFNWLCIQFLCHNFSPGMDVLKV